MSDRTSCKKYDDDDLGGILSNTTAADDLKATLWFLDNFFVTPFVVLFLIGMVYGWVKNLFN
jgi:hypothetical protein